MPYKDPNHKREKGHSWYLVHKAEILKKNKLWDLLNPEKYKFHCHKRNARKRKIEFLLTYQEWLDIWYLSGHWWDRGSGLGKYQMCRFGDSGPYSIDNVYIDSLEQNLKDRDYTRCAKKCKRIENDL